MSQICEFLICEVYTKCIPTTSQICDVMNLGAEHFCITLTNDKFVNPCGRIQAKMLLVAITIMMIYICCSFSKTLSKVLNQKGNFYFRTCYHECDWKFEYPQLCTNV